MSHFLHFLQILPNPVIAVGCKNETKRIAVDNSVIQIDNRHINQNDEQIFRRGGGNVPLKYVPFRQESAKEQSVLQNFSRGFRCMETEKILEILNRGMPLYEMEHQETAGMDGSGNLLIRGTCISACAYLKEKGIQADLVYIDPPFASGADYVKKICIRRSAGDSRDIMKTDGASEAEAPRFFEEKLYGDVWEKEQYLSWMCENLLAIKEVMSETAVIYVHLDYHISHYVKILLDGIFGEENFRNEIVWCYSTQGRPKDRFAPKHDTIFCYGKSRAAYFNEEGARIPYTEEYIRSHFQSRDEQGRACRKRFDGGKWRTYYPDEGMIDNDYWLIPYENSRTRTRADYVTQKPEALLEKIIKASSERGMVVADFFGGSGVAAAAAAKFGRRFIHCDISVNSIQAARDRLRADGAFFDVLNVLDGVRIYRNPVQTMEKIKKAIPGLKRARRTKKQNESQAAGGSEKPAGQFWNGVISERPAGRVPVHLPDLRNGREQLMDQAFLDYLVNQAVPALDGSVKKAVVCYADRIDKDKVRKFIEDNKKSAVEIELRDLKEVLDGMEEKDRVKFHTEKLADPDEEKNEKRYCVVIEKFVSGQIQEKITAFNRKKERAKAKRGRSFTPIAISKEGLELIEFLSVDCSASSGKWRSAAEVRIDRQGCAVRDGVAAGGVWDGKIYSEELPLRLKIRNICGDETIWML